MRIAITGAGGQLGLALRHTLEPEHEIIALTHTDLDLERPDSVDHLIATNAELVIHPAAYTNVDGCARDPLKAYRANALGTQYVALACQQLDVPLVYVSTNEVFDGTASAPYFEYDQTRPINPYGWSKWVGEQVVRDRLQRYYIARVAWLFGGERNFVRTVLRLSAERSELSMVADEIGSPTYTHDAAAAIGRLIQKPFYGIYHLVNEGACSRFDFAAEILRLAGREQVRLNQMKLADYKRDSVVPPHTPLRNVAAADLGITMRTWQEALAEYIQKIS